MTTFVHEDYTNDAYIASPRHLSLKCLCQVRVVCGHVYVMYMSCICHVYVV